MKPICIIPLSSQLNDYHHKHVFYLAGQPLFCHAVNKAKASQIFKEIIVVTDDAIYADIAQQQDVVVKVCQDNIKTATELIHQVLNDYSAEQSYMILNASAIGIETAQLVESYATYMESKMQHLMSVVALPNHIMQLIKLNDANEIKSAYEVTDRYYPVDAIMISTKKYDLQVNDFNNMNTVAFVLPSDRQLIINNHQDFVHVLGENYFDYKTREKNGKTMFYQLYDEKLTQPSSDKVLLGDSRTVNIHLPNFKNFGLGGVTLATLLEKIEEILTEEVKLALVSIGVNDFITKYPFTTIQKNFEKLIKLCQDKNIRLLLTTIPYTLYRYEVSNEAIREMNQWLYEYCNEQAIPLLDLNDLLSHDDMLKYQYTNDGLHFTEVANRLIEQQYHDFIEQNS